MPEIDGVGVEVVERIERFDVPTEFIDNPVDGGRVTVEVGRLHSVSVKGLAARHGQEPLGRRPGRQRGISVGKRQLGQPVSGVGDRRLGLDDDPFGVGSLVSANALERLASKQRQCLTQQLRLLSGVRGVR